MLEETTPTIAMEIYNGEIIGLTMPDGVILRITDHDLDDTTTEYTSDCLSGKVLTAEATAAEATGVKCTVCHTVVPENGDIFECTMIGLPVCMDCCDKKNFDGSCCKEKPNCMIQLPPPSLSE